MIRAASPHWLARSAAPWLALPAAAGVAGVFAAGKAEEWVGRTPALLLLTLLMAAMFFVAFAYLGASAIVLWPVAAAGGYLLQYPRDHPIITFDRLWIGGMLAYIVLTPRSAPRSASTRLLYAGLLWLFVSFGVRAAATDATLGGPLATWIDAIVLPVILFVACERYCLGGAERARRLAGALMLGGGVLAAIGIAERIWGFELATLTGGSVRFDPAVDQARISGPYPVPEPYALSLIICLAATFYWILSRRPGQSYRWATLLVVLDGAAIALVLFRAAWIAAIVVVIAAFGIRPARFGRAFTVTGLALAIALAATSQLQHDKTFATRASDTTNIYGRLATYEQALGIFRSEPLVGVGVNRYHDVADERRPDVVADVASVTYPHSSYLGLLAEQGLLGVAPLLLLSYAVWRVIAGLRALSFWSREAALLTATVVGAAFGYLLMSLTLTMLPYGPSNAFFAAWLGVAAARLDALSRRSEAGNAVQA